MDTNFDASDLVSTHVVCERISAMQEQARLPEFLVQNSLSAPTQAFEECGVQSTLPLPPPPRNENLVRTWDFGFQLVQSNSPRHLCGSCCVETNRCIPQGYRLVSHSVSIWQIPTIMESNVSARILEFS